LAGLLTAVIIFHPIENCYEVGVPFDSISLEMLYRGMYHFGLAYDKGKASDPVSYFAAPENQDLRVVKIRKKHDTLDLSPFPRPRLTFPHLLNLSRMLKKGLEYLSKKHCHA